MESTLNQGCTISRLSPSHSWIQHMSMLGSGCPAGGRPPDSWNDPMEAFFFAPGCVALNEITDKTTCANWVLLRSQSDNDAFALPKGTCEWLYLSADIQGVYCVLFVCKEGLCGCACTVHLSLRRWSQCAARVQCPMRGSIRSKEKKTLKWDVPHNLCPVQPQRSLLKAAKHLWD